MPAPCAPDPQGADADRPVLPGAGFLLRPVAGGDAPALRAIHATPEVSRWWQQPDADFPFDEPEAVRFVVEVDGEVAGLVQYGEETDPDYRHAWIDVFLDPRRHGRGLGTAVVRRLARHLLDDRGHHRLTIDPAAANEVAVRCYEKVGFRRVGVMRRYERDRTTGTWRDALLLDLLREELTE